jgi:hypothetical protein
MSYLGPVQRYYFQADLVWPAVLRIRDKTISDPGFRTSDPRSRIQQQQQMQRGKNLLSYLYLRHKYQKIEKKLFLNWQRKKL